METLNPVDYQPAHSLPHAQTSHLRESRNSSPAAQPPHSATRMAYPADMQHQTQSSTRSAPASQESMLSARSEVGSPNGLTLYGSNSDLSSYATNDTDFTSPSSSAESKAQANAPSSALNLHRVTTPENALDEPARDASAHSLASPMNFVSPGGIPNGAKRTASGHVKNAPSLPTNYFVESMVPRSPRRQSVSSPSTKASELAQSLRSRLEYAMAKVQHGWEHKSIAEVEQLAARKVLGHRHTVSNSDRPTSSGLSSGTSQLSIFSSPRVAADSYASPPTKRRSGMYGLATTPYLQTSPPMGSTPHLQPAAEIRPTIATASRPVYASTALNNHLTSPREYHHSSRQTMYGSMSPPRTPLASAITPTTASSAKHQKIRSSPRAHRPPTIRTQTQTAEAERDALQALYELASPRTSSQLSSSRHSASTSTFPDSNSGHASPWQNSNHHDVLSSTSSTPRRVAFRRSESDSDGLEHSSASTGRATASEDDPLPNGRPAYT